MLFAMVCRQGEAVEARELICRRPGCAYGEYGDDEIGFRVDPANEEDETGAEADAK